jgi:hypothetical protein
MVPTSRGTTVLVALMAGGKVASAKTPVNWSNVLRRMLMGANT